MTKTASIGLDLGLTSLKAAAFDEQGRELHVESVQTPRAHRRADVHDVDMHTLWDLSCQVLRALAEHLSDRGIQPVGLGVTGAGNGLYIADEQLQPVRAAIPSTDSRAQGLADQITAEDAIRLQAVTGSRPWAAQPTTLLRWVKDHDPESYARSRWVFACKDWVTSQLIGQAGGDFSDASAFGVLDIADGGYSSLPFEILGLPACDVERLPPPSTSGSVVGTVTQDASARCGLPEGLPVIAGALDCVAATYGAGGNQPGDVTIIVGTWAINGVVVPATTPLPQVGMMSLMPDPDHLLAMEVAPTSAANLEWLARAVSEPGQPIAVPLLVEEAATTSAGADDLLFLPFVYGAEDVPAGSGTFLGAASTHSRGHLTRAVLEGIAHYHHVQVRRILASGVDLNAKPWRLAGGGARSALWSQIFADVLGQPVSPQPAMELGARGIAALVAEATGLETDAWWSSADNHIVHPSESAPLLQERGRVFERCLTALQPVWSALGPDSD